MNGVGAFGAGPPMLAGVEALPRIGIPTSLCLIDFRLSSGGARRAALSFSSDYSG
jgi:hypothetical protein